MCPPPLSTHRAQSACFALTSRTLWPRPLLRKKTACCLLPADNRPHAYWPRSCQPADAAATMLLLPPLHRLMAAPSLLGRCPHYPLSVIRCLPALATSCVCCCCCCCCCFLCLDRTVCHSPHWPLSCHSLVSKMEPPLYTKIAPVFQCSFPRVSSRITLSST